MLDELRELVNLLHTRTDDGTVTWRATAADAYQVSVRGSIIEISKSNDYDDRSWARISIKDKDGEILDSFDDDTIDDNISGDKFRYFKLMVNLYEKARRSALGVDKVLKGILEDLRDDIPF